MTRKIKVIVIDDSTLTRKIISKILSSDPDIVVIDEAADAYEAREKIKLHNPDVITLDIEMPKMDGITFLKKIMALRPMPVVMVSTLTQRGSEVSIEALEIGAFDYVPKPTSDLSELYGYDNTHFQAELIEKVKASAKSNLKRFVQARNDITKSIVKLEPYKNENIIIAIGSSTGGVEALKEIITKLPPNIPPVLITQHMPPNFTASLAKRLSSISAVKVHEAQDNQLVEMGNVYIAPGGNRHLELGKLNNKYVCKLIEGETVNGHRPSVDVLFNSVAKLVKNNAIGIILTGMGSDGAKGLLEMREAGAVTLGQNEDSCIVYGMPKVAMQIGAVSQEYSIEVMAEKLVEKVRLLV